jgi:hypothetical protein
VADATATGQIQAGVKVSVTAPGRVGASRLDVECTECGASERKYVPRGTVSVEHVCGSGWQLEGKPAARVAG